MMQKIINRLKAFREEIYRFFSSRRDAAFELVDSLSSNTQAKNVVELSLNAVHQRNYCSITRVLDEYYDTDLDQKKKHLALSNILSRQCALGEKRPFYLFALDATSNPRCFARCQEDRSFVYSTNEVSGNKPITIGHQYSFVTFLPEKEQANSKTWVVPISCDRIATSQKGVEVGMKQMSACLKAHDDFKNHLCVSVGDSAYSSLDALCEAAKNENQVHISRLRSNRVLYSRALEGTYSGRGRKKRYGEPFRLKEPCTHQPEDERLTFEITTQKGKKRVVKIRAWNTLIMRGTRKINTTHYPLRLIQITLWKETGEQVFEKPLWLVAIGQRRFELSLSDLYHCYMQRFDIEHYFRFSKRKLLLDQCQTPELEHEMAWWQLNMIAYTQLYLARHLAHNLPRPWEKSLKSYSSASPTNVQKDFSRIIQVIGTPAKPPKVRKKSPGRALGQKQNKRPRHSIVIKPKKMKKSAMPP